MCLQHKLAVRQKRKNWYRFLHSLLLLNDYASLRYYSHVQAEDNTTSAAQHSGDESNQRGGEASTSAASVETEKPTGNDHTAKWKLYTTKARKLVAQVLFVHVQCKELMYACKVDDFLFCNAMYDEVLQCKPTFVQCASTDCNFIACVHLGRWWWSY